MYVNERFVRNAARSILPGSTLIRVPRALSCFQDVYLLAGAQSFLSPRKYEYGPVGTIEALEIEGGRVHLRGRAADLSEGSSITVSAWLNDTCLGECRPTIPRPDVVAWTGFESSLLSGFSLTVGLPPGYSPDDLLLVKATSKCGLSYILHVGTLAKSTAVFAPENVCPQGCPLKTSWWPTVRRVSSWIKSFRGR
jgi:hypothetical protein